MFMPVTTSAWIGPLHRVALMDCSGDVSKSRHKLDSAAFKQLPWEMGDSYTYIPHPNIM